MRRRQECECQPCKPDPAIQQTMDRVHIPVNSSPVESAVIPNQNVALEPQKKRQAQKCETALSKIESLSNTNSAVSAKAQSADSPRKTKTISEKEEECSRILVKYMCVGPKKNSVRLKREETVNESSVFLRRSCFIAACLLIWSTEGKTLRGL